MPRGVGSAAQFRWLVQQFLMIKKFFLSSFIIDGMCILNMVGVLLVIIFIFYFFYYGKYIIIFIIIVFSNLELLILIAFF